MTPIHGLDAKRSSRDKENANRLPLGAAHLRWLPLDHVGGGIPTILPANPMPPLHLAPMLGHLVVRLRLHAKATLFAVAPPPVDGLRSTHNLHLLAAQVGLDFNCPDVGYATTFAFLVGGSSLPLLETERSHASTKPRTIAKA